MRKVVYTPCGSNKTEKKGYLIQLNTMPDDGSTFALIEAMDGTIDEAEVKHVRFMNPTSEEEEDKRKRRDSCIKNILQ